MAEYTPINVDIATAESGIRATPSWITTVATNLLLNYSIAGTISGVVKLSNAVQANRKVLLYYRPSGKPIRSAITESNGTFTFSNLDPADTGNYFAVAFLDDAGYNALIFDKLTAG